MPRNNPNVALPMNFLVLYLVLFQNVRFIIAVSWLCFRNVVPKLYVSRNIYVSDLSFQKLCVETSISELAFHRVSFSICVARVSLQHVHL